MTVYFVQQKLICVNQYQDYWGSDSDLSLEETHIAIKLEDVGKPPAEKFYSETPVY